MPYKRAILSASVNTGWSIVTPGRLTPLNEDNRPAELSTFSFTSWSPASKTSKDTVPSEINTLSPGRRLRSTSGWGKGNTSGRSDAASETMETTSPGLRRTEPSIWPKRSLMPPRSCRMATGRWRCLANSRNVRITSPCSSRVPWEKFNRAQSMPASSN